MKNLISAIISTRRDNVKLWAFLFFLFTVIFFLLANYCWKNTPFMTSILNLLASSFLTVCIFSILIGFSDFMNYVIRRLREVVIEHTYLKTLAPELRIELRKRLNALIFGEGAIRDPGSIYHFIEQRLTELYSSPYRCEFHDMYYYSNSEYEDFWLQDNHTSYIFFKSKEETQKMYIKWHNKSRLPNTDKSIKDCLKKLEVSVDDEILTLKPEDTDGFTLEPNKKNIFLNKKFDINAIVREEEDKFVSVIELNIELPDEIFTENKNSVVVDVKAQKLTHKSDNIVNLRMTYPTRDMMLSCEFKEGNYQTSCAVFGFTPRTHKTRECINSAFVNIKEWVLPGHGAVITWLPI